MGYKCHHRKISNHIDRYITIEPCPASGIVDETIISIFRAGSGPAITYFAEDYKIDHGKG